MGGLTVVGLLMAGWSSFNKYSLLGGLRSAAQIVSYEIPLTLSVVGVIMLAGTMSLNHIVLAQSGSILDWFVFKQPLAALIFFIAATAEANRTPFDMTEADSEIVAGFATEYSGMRFGFFFFAEYVNVFIVSALAATLFFGGWTAPFNWPWAYQPELVRPARDLGFFGLGRHRADRASASGRIFFALLDPALRRPRAGASGRRSALGLPPDSSVLVVGPHRRWPAFIAFDWVRDLSGSWPRRTSSSSSSSGCEPRCRASASTS